MAFIGALTAMLVGATGFPAGRDHQNLRYDHSEEPSLFFLARYFVVAVALLFVARDLATSRRMPIMLITVGVVMIAYAFLIELTTF